MSITLLPQQVRDQIAAGEVVERPASVVKELIENSIDAEASFIEIWIEGGGVDLVKIQDNGSGIKTTDITKALERFATSKLHHIDELFEIQSFGFRGEALAAIASIAEIELTSKTEFDESAIKIKADNGVISDPENAAHPIGTTISVQNLFKTTPARKQYLKTNDTEFRQILKTIQQFALAHPKIAFRLHHQGKTRLNLVTSSDKYERFYQLTKSNANEYLQATKTLPTLACDLLFSKPGYGLGHKRNQFIFINGRSIEDHKLSFAISEAYRQTVGLEKHLHPGFLLNLQIDPILVDVNVHPRKLEVKFAEPGEVFRFVQHIVKTELNNFSQGDRNTCEVNSMNSNNSKEFFQKTSVENEVSTSPKYNTQKFSTQHQARGQEVVRYNEILAGNSQLIGLEPAKTLKLIGQVGKRYIVAERDETVIFFDQHALHERQRFNVLWKTYQNEKKLSAQALLTPVISDLTLESIGELEAHKENLESLGFIYQKVNDTKIRVVAIPTIMSDYDIENIVELFVITLTDDIELENPVDDIMRKVLEYKACRSAVKYGDSMDTVEMQKLLDDFLDGEWTTLCPHGRPNNLIMTFEELDKNFHR